MPYSCNLQSIVGENTPGEILSGEEGEEVQGAGGYEEGGWYDEDQTQYDISIRSEATLVWRVRI
jgi:hypothetical protein